MDYQSLNKLSQDWNDIEKIVVYGYGKVAQRNIGKLYKDFKIISIIDNNPALKGQTYEEIPIKSFSEEKENISKYKVVVCTSSLAYDSIKNDLQSIGMKEYADYCRLEDFMPEWYWKNKNEVCLSQMSSSINSKCTLNCEHCNMLMPYYKEHFWSTEEDIMRDMELLFQRVDYLASYFIIGGEPLLNENLPKILESVYNKYKDKIGYIQVITNGTILPSAELIDVCKRCNIKIRLSDYTNQVPYSKKLEEVKKCLSDNQVDNSMGVYETWLALGFPNKVEPIGKTPAEAKQHMLNCSQGCHMLGDGKLFYCGLMYSVGKSRLYRLREGDYVDLSKSEGTLLDDKLRVLRYCLGDMENEYVSLCNICYGAGADNPYEVPAGVQMPR